MILTPNLETGIVLIVIGVVLYAILSVLPPGSRNLVMIVSTVIVILGVVDILLSLLHI